MKYIALSDEQYRTLVEENDNFCYIQDENETVTPETLLHHQAMWAHRINALLNFILGYRMAGLDTGVFDDLSERSSADDNSCREIW